MINAMNKITKENYEEIMKDLEPLYEKWSVAGVNGAIWRYQRTRSRLQELNEQKSLIEKELKKYEKTS